MKVRTFQIIIVSVISALIGYYIGVSKINYEWQNYKPSLSIINREPPPQASAVDFSLFWNVLNKIENTYYDKKALDPKKLVDGAISGMVQSLGDPYTVYLPASDNSDFKKGLAGQQFEGIGAELGMRDKQIIVISPLEKSPAQKAGIQPGDAILKVDNQLTTSWTLAQAVEKIRGPKGTTVGLTILHKSNEKPLEIKITRETIKVKSVEAYVKKISEIDSLKNYPLSQKENEIAYIRVAQFGDSTNDEWMAAVNKIAPQIKEGKVSGLVLDLRNNPGGYLNDANFIASEFLESGTVVIQEKANGEKVPFNVSRKGLLTKIKVAVLINKGSASASEIVAGALRDHNRAKLVGETSFGKGTIQQAEDIGQGSGLHITIAKWLTPNGIWVNGKGLNPDITVSYDEKNSANDPQLEKSIAELIK